MQFFLDTAEVEQIREAHAWGVVDGITTNPSLIAKSGREHHAVLREICEVVSGPISAEVIATETEAMIEEGRMLAKIHPNIVVKIPMIEAGVPAIRALAAEDIRVNVTLIFQPLQALVAAKAGAAYVSPFLGRLDDIGHVGMDVVAGIREIFDNYGFACEILAASLRHPWHVLEAARAGADCATMPYKVLGQMIRHPLTDIGLEKFLADHRAATAG